MADMERLHALIEAASNRQAREEAQRAEHLTAAFQRWAEECYSPELRAALGWSIAWDQEKRRPYAGFTIERGHRPYIVRLYRGESAEAARLVLVSPTAQEINLATRDEDELLLVLRRWGV